MTTAGTGRVIINTGDGKGKTSAALGVAFRAAGHGQQVAVVQFIKAGAGSGEIAAAKCFSNIAFFSMGAGYIWDLTDVEQDRKKAEEALALCVELAETRSLDLLVMDELNYALKFGLVELDEVIRFLDTKPGELSVIMTGRGAPPELIARADTVTEMRVVKHAFDSGMEAQQGIEY